MSWFWWSDSRSLFTSAALYWNKRCILKHQKCDQLVLPLYLSDYSLQRNRHRITHPKAMSHASPDLLFHIQSKEKWIKLRIKVKKENNNGLCCQMEGAAARPAWPGCIPKPAIINRLTSTEKKGRPESAGQKKSQQTKKKQIKSTIIKHRCYKENKLHKIYWFLTKLDICGKDIRSSSQVQSGQACGLTASASPPSS